MPHTSSSADILELDAPIKHSDPNDICVHLRRADSLFPSRLHPRSVVQEVHAPGAGATVEIWSGTSSVLPDISEKLRAHHGAVLTND